MPGILDFLKQNIYIILGGLCVILVGVIFLTVSNSGAAAVIPGDYVLYASSPLESEAVEEARPFEQLAEQFVIVHIVGEVNRPGVVQLPYGSRINDVLELADGATYYADLARINLAAFVTDAMQIVVPAFGEEVAVAQVIESGGGLINVNTASHQELQTLPGVGPVLAQNIIDFREAHGGFSNIEELINVSRIGTATMERLRPLVTV